MGKAGLGWEGIRSGPNTPFAAAIVLRVGFSLGICLILLWAAPDFSSGREKDPGGVREEPFQRRIRREESQFQRLEARIARERDLERQRGSRAKSLLRQLDRLSARLAAEDQRLRLVKRQMAPLERRLEQLNGRLSRLRIDQRLTRHKMQRWLQAMYMDGPVAYARLVIMAQSVQDIFDRWSWLTDLARSDLRLILHCRAQEETFRTVEVEAEKSLDAGRVFGTRGRRPSAGSAPFMGADQGSCPSWRKGRRIGPRCCGNFLRPARNFAMPSSLCFGVATRGCGAERPPLSG